MFGQMFDKLKIETIGLSNNGMKKIVIIIMLYMLKYRKATETL